MAQRGTTAKIDLAELERLSAMQCTDEEVAAWFGVTTRTIERRRKNAKFAEVMDRGKAKGRISVRRQQLKLLEAGNATMGVWLGKQILGQRDEIQYDINGGVQVLVVMPRPGVGSSATGMARQLIAAEDGEETVEVEPAPSETTDLEPCAITNGDMTEDDLRAEIDRLKAENEALKTPTRGPISVE